MSITGPWFMAAFMVFRDNDGGSLIGDKDAGGWNGGSPGLGYGGRE